MSGFDRRRVLRGLVGGSAVTVGLPLLNVFLNGNGNAMADGKPMPVRFGTWHWGLGMQTNVFVPKKTGLDYDLPEEIASWKPIQKHMNLFTNTTAFRDNFENLCHYSGWVILRTGSAPKDGGHIPGESVDVTVANQIGRTTRFKMLTATGTGETGSTLSYENQNTPNQPEISPLAFYTRVFGPDFQDPNAPEFKPNPRIMVRKSVLSGVMDEIKVLNAKVGAEDRARLDQYFTGLRHLERQFEQQLTKPEPIASCSKPAELKSEPPAGKEIEVITQRHKMMTDIMVMAVACDQTRVFNMAMSTRSGDPSKAGYEKPHHTATHEERIDDVLGYQKEVSGFTRKLMAAWAYYVEAYTKVKEGDGTLLDNVFIYATTDHGYARVHSLDGIPLMTAGGCGGKVKNGYHIDLKGDTGCRIGYTGLRLMGVNAPAWGTKSNQTSKDVGEILA
ncbi:MAG: DUF1552 domain-containing protein [Rhodospirillaceae bacterium]